MKKVLALAVIAALAAMPGVGSAADCEVHVDDAGPAEAHIADPSGDAQGVVLGDGSGGALGDLYTSPDEADDILAAYMSRNGDGDLEVHIVVRDLLGAEVNLLYYLLWDYSGGDDLRRTRWIEAFVKGIEATYSYGFIGMKTTGARGFNEIGHTSGHLTPGSPGEVVIDLPYGETVTDPWNGGVQISNDGWGAPAPGSLLGFDPVVSGDPFGAESRILVGSPQALPQPSPFTHGFVFPVDGSANATKFCDARV